jgi:hypothetical protein
VWIETAIRLVVVGEVGLVNDTRDRTAGRLRRIVSTRVIFMMRKCHSPK